MIEALDAGADDYVAKRFGMGELLARVRAALRRAGPSDSEALVETPHFTIDLAAKKVHVGVDEVHLTPTEWGMLEMLVRNPGRLISQTMILSEVWGPSYEDDPLLALLHRTDSAQVGAGAQRSAIFHHRGRDGISLRACT